MEANRRKQLLLGALALALVFAIYRGWSPSTSLAPKSPSNGRGQTAKSGRMAVPSVNAPDVHLHTLDEERPRPDTSDRNLFRFKPKAPVPPPGARNSGLERPVVPVPAGPPPPPPLPPMTFKFIGIVEAPQQSAKIAVLSDGRNVFHGREGDIIEGRYRILRIGAESIEMAYLDGRGRQTIRLTGS